MVICLRCVVLFVCFLVFAPVSSGAVITFDMLSGGDVDGLDETAGGTVTKDGLSMTAAANTGILNCTTTSFGINASGSGDDTDEFDAGTGTAEIMTFRFDSDVELVSIDFFSIGSGDTADLASAANSFSLAISSSIATDPFDVNQFVAAGTDVELIQTGGQFGIHAITVNTVPEPATILLCVAGMGMIFKRRRR